MKQRFLPLALCIGTLFTQTTMAQTALDKGKDFLASNATQPDVKTTASGLQYKILSEGKGKMPKATDSVLVNYRGTLLDGTEFDSSYKRNEPISFPLNGVIPGWTEGLQLVKEGGKSSSSFRPTSPTERAEQAASSAPTRRSSSRLSC